MTEEVFKVRFTQDGAKEIVRSFDTFIRGADSAEDAANKLVKATNEVRRSADPAQRAYDGLAKSINTLDKAQRAGIISASERMAVQSKLTITSQNALRPIGSLISKIDQETKAWSTSNVQRQATMRTMAQVEALMRRGVAVTEQERNAIMKANTTLFQRREGLRMAAQAQEAMAASAQKSANAQVTAANKIERENAALLASYENTYRNSGTIVESALAKRTAALAQATAAERAGIITATQLAEVEGRLARQYAEQVDPLQKVERLQRERVGYMAGLFQQGRQLAQVNRDLVRLDAQGVQLDMQRVASLRAHAKAADRLQDVYEGLNRTRTLFSSVLGGVGLGIAVGFFTKSLDDITTYQNKLRLVASDQANANRLFEEVAQIAIRSRSALGDTVTAYARIARSTKDLGLSQRDALNITEAVTKSFKISGASIQEASASAVQFGQALASDRLGGDELRSILEQAPRLSQAVVDGINLMNKTDPSQLPKKLRDEIKKTGTLSIGTLRDVAKKGLLTGEVVSRAVLSQQKAINDEFLKTTPTIAESFIVLKTNWELFLNSFNKGTGAAGMISKAILFIADNLETIISVGAVVGSTFAGLWVATQVQKFASFIAGIPVALSAASGAINGNTLALNSENAALSTNTQLQVANAAARRGVGVAAAGQAAGSAAGGVAGAAGGVASAATAANLSSGAAAAAAMRLQLTGAATAAGATAARTGILAGALGAAKAAAGGMGGFLTGMVGKLGLIGAAVGLIASIWLLVKDRIKVADDQMLIYAEGSTQKAIRGSITLGDVVGGVFATISGQQDDLTKGQIANQTVASEHGKKKAVELSDIQKKAAQDSLDASAQAAVSTLSVYDTMHDGVAKGAADMVGNLITGATYISGAFSNAFTLIGALANNIFNSIAKRIASFYNSALLPIINKAAEFGIGKGGSKMSVTGEQIDIGALSKQLEQKTIADAVAAGKAGREATARAITTSAANRERGGQLGGLNPAGTALDRADGGKGGKGKKDKTLDELKSKYRQLRDELNPLLKITEDYEADQKTLNDAERRGLITTAEKADLMGRLKTRYEEARDPLGKYIKDTEAELAILNLDSSQREAATAILSKEREERDRLRRELTAEEKARISNIETLKVNKTRMTEMTDAIKDAQIARNIELGSIGKSSQLAEAESRARATLGDAIKNNVAGAEEALKQETAKELAFIKTRDAGMRVVEMYETINSAQKAYAQDSVALNTLLKSGKITLEQYNRELRGLTMNVLALEKSGQAGFERAMINIKSKTEDMASGVQTAFENAFSSIEDQFVGLFTGKEFDAQALFAGFAEDAARIFYRSFMDKPITGIGEQFGIPGFGKTGMTDQQIEAQNVYINGVNLAGMNLGGTTPAGAAPVAAGGLSFGGTGMTTGATGALGDPSAIVSANQTAAGQVQGIWGAASQAMSGNWMGAIQTMITQSGLFQTAQQTASAATLATTTANATAGASIVAATEGAKTIATETGVATRTATEVAGAATSKGLTISTALTEIGAKAVSAAAGVYSAIAGIPYVGPFLAPAAAAAALGAVMAFGNKIFSAEQGFGSVPYDGAMTSLHKEEMVLPAKYANPLRDQLTSGDSGDAGGGDTNVDLKNVTLFDPAMMLDAMQTTAGQRVVLNIIESNPEAIKRLLSV